MFLKKSIVIYVILTFFFPHLFADKSPVAEKSAEIRGFARAFKCACGRCGCVTAINSSVLINGTGRTNDVAKADEEQSFCPSPADANLRSDSSRPTVTPRYFAKAGKSRLRLEDSTDAVHFSNVMMFRFSSCTRWILRTFMEADDKLCDFCAKCDKHFCK